MSTQSDDTAGDTTDNTVDALADLQRRFQRHVLDGDESIARSIDSTEDVPVAARLGVYAEAYRLRLTEALGKNAPCLQRLLGEEEFAAVAQSYLRQHPSTFASIRWFGARLGESLRDSHPAQPWLAELARWEWAVAATFDAADAPPVAISQLAAITPDAWPGLSFEFHPSVQRLDLRTNAAALYKAISEEAPLPEPTVLAATQAWLLWRHEQRIQYRSMDAAEAVALSLMRRGGTFASMCELLNDWHPSHSVPVAAAGSLKRWVADGLVVATRSSA